MLKAYTDKSAVRCIKWLIPNSDYLRNLASEIDHLAGLLEPRPGEYVSKELAQNFIVECLVERKPMVTKPDEVIESNVS